MMKVSIYELMQQLSAEYAEGYVDGTDMTPDEYNVYLDGLSDQELVDLFNDQFQTGYTVDQLDTSAPK